MVEIIVGTLSGIIASFISSMIFLSFINNRLPKIRISEDIITENDPESGEKALAVKILNDSKHSIIDVSFTLYGVEYQNDDKSLAHYKKISSKKIPFVERFDKKDDKYKYAVIATMPLHNITLEEIRNRYHDIMVEIIARESYYNTFSTKSIPFAPSSVKENHIFELGNITKTRVRPK